MRILLAPDKFKGALSAKAAAEAMAAGVRDVRPDAEIDMCPMGDGGEGTGEILAQRLGFEARVLEVLDPLGRPRTAGWWCSPANRAAIVELAEASGIELLTRAERDPLRTTSFGTGQLLRAALDSGCTAITLCVGGSATVDGGAGCVQALGCELCDANGSPIPAPVPGGALQKVHSIHWRQHEHFGIRVLCDVDNPLLGPRGAAAVFGPQKGASPEAVETLEGNLAHWADVLERCTGRVVRDIVHGGASGGVPAGLHAICNAGLTSGAMAVAWDVELFQRLSGCDLCLTGEGRIDEQTAGGKVVFAVAQLARAQGVRAVALVGAAAPSLANDPTAIAALGLSDIRAITRPGTPLESALRETADNLRSAAAAVTAASGAGR